MDRDAIGTIAVIARGPSRRKATAHLLATIPRRGTRLFTSVTWIRGAFSLR
jgi:hypothetical protein